MHACVYCFGVIRVTNDIAGSVGSQVYASECYTAVGDRPWLRGTNCGDATCRRWSPMDQV